MQSDIHTEDELFGAAFGCGARVLLIGRRALIAYGLPVLTSDYDFWVAQEDLEVFNEAFSGLDMHPNKTAEQARKLGRYVIENGEHLDVMTASHVMTLDRVRVAFDDLWSRREHLEFSADISLSLPCLDDMILTKRFSARPKDAEDLRLLEELRRSRMTP